MVEKGWGFRDNGTFKLGVSHKWYDELSRLIGWCLYTESDGYSLISKFHMRYQVDYLLPLKLQKISYYFGLCQKILLANQCAGFFTFDLLDLLILIPGVHCYIVLVFVGCSQACPGFTKVIWNNKLPIFLKRLESLYWFFACS